jgi:TetR/AcrR family transcriptional repressor of lmrAB and yxaGH operons
LAATVATNSPTLLARSGSIFETWQKVLADKFIKTGLSTQEATDFTTTLIAASEGAVVMARSAKNIAPFDRVAGQLVAQARLLEAT